MIGPGSDKNSFRGGGGQYGVSMVVRVESVRVDFLPYQVRCSISNCSGSLVVVK